jgi:hypothetical protein
LISRKISVKRRIRLQYCKQPNNKMLLIVHIANLNGPF